MDWDSGEIAGKVLLSIRLINSSGYAGHRKAKIGKGSAPQRGDEHGKGSATLSKGKAGHGIAGR